MISVYLNNDFIDLMSFFADIDEDDLVELDNTEYRSIRELIKQINELNIDADEKKFAIKSLTDFVSVPA